MAARLPLHANCCAQHPNKQSVAQDGNVMRLGFNVQRSSRYTAMAARMARMSSGVVRQQPPMSRAPAACQRCAGV
jgi:hypothetical protein